VEWIPNCAAASQARPANDATWYKIPMPSFRVETPLHSYAAVVERGVIASTAQYLPPKAGKVFVVSNEEIWRHQGGRVAAALADVPHDVLFLPNGEDQKRLAPLETLADKMVELGADRTSVVVAFGGGIVTDMAGFLAAIFMRGIPLVQIPTTLLGQVDAAIGGKTGVNLVSGKNLIGSFHQPIVVLIDPDVLDTLPDREYRSGLWEIVKAGIIRERGLFDFLASDSAAVLSRRSHAVDRIICDSVRMKAEVVSSDEREGDLRRILNLGHTFGHALESETGYVRFLHGEAVAWGMRAAVHLAESTGHLSAEDSVDILEMLTLYGPIPPLDGISPDNLHARLVHDKKTVHGKVHFVLPVRIGEATVVSGVDDKLVHAAIRSAMA
jgi:3-dehydroquinate synthase